MRATNSPAQRSRSVAALLNLHRPLGENLPGSWRVTREACADAV
jgi:hypothetical protein